MRKISITLALCLSGLLLTGCSDESYRQAQAARTEFQEALSKYNAAQTGFVDAKAVDSKKTDLNLDEYRILRLTEAEKALTPLLTKGPVSQQVAAARFLSDIHASKARYISKQAFVAASEVGASGGEVLSYLTSVDLSDQLGKTYENVDETRLLSDLSSDETGLNRKISELAGNVETLTSKAKKTQDTIDGLKQQKEKSATEAQKLRDEAFKLKGDAQLKGYDKATLEQRRADRAGAEAEQLSVKLQVINSEIKILKKQVELVREAVANVQEQSKAAKERQENAQAVTKEARTAQDGFTEKLNSRMTQWAADYTRNVDAPLKAAELEIDDAIKILLEARSKAGKDALNVQIDLLMRQMDRTHILAMHAMAAESYSSTMQTIATSGSRLLPTKASYFTDNAQAADKNLELLRNAAYDAITKGTSLASALAEGKPETDPIAELAKEQMRQLEAYGKRAKAVAAAAPAAPATETPTTAPAEAAPAPAAAPGA